MTDDHPSASTRGLPVLAAIALDLLTTRRSNLGGVLRGRWNPLLERWLATLARRCRVLRLPASVDSDALEGTLDVAATLASGRRRMQTGLLDRDADVLLCIGAERLTPDAQRALCRWLDTRAPDEGPRLLLIDESLDDEPGLAVSALGDRLPILLTLDIEPPGDSDDEIAWDDLGSPDFVVGSRPAPTDLPSPPPLDDARLRSLGEAAAMLGIDSVRALLHTLAVARVLATSAQAPELDDEALAIAVQLCLASRATRMPAGVDEAAPADESAPPPAPTDDAEATEAPTTPPGDTGDNERNDDREPSSALEDRLVASARAALPEHLLAGLASGSRQLTGGGGRGGDAVGAGDRGRPVGARRPRGRRELMSLDILATLREAVPRQRLRHGGRESAASARTLDVRREDLRVRRRRPPARTTTIFVVDASGSAAMHRLGEAKGAVELLLADCYVRRDRVALVTFRGHDARIDLPPTRSLTRAKRCLASLPGGGGTPLAAGLARAAVLVRQVERDGDRPVVVLMTDGRPNIARDGLADRARAHSDAEQAARALARSTTRSIVVDTAPRPRPDTRTLAGHLHARYVPLPRSGRPVWPDLLRRETTAA